MLHFVSTRLAISYLLLCTLGCIGVLQIQATRLRLAGLSLWSGRGARWWGYVAGFLIVVGSFAGFYAFAPGIFVPGLAGSELVVLFTAAFILALVVNLTVASLTVWHSEGTMVDADGGEEVSSPQLRGWLHVPQGSGPHPALCLIPEVGSPARDLRAVAAQFLGMGFVTLAIDWIAGNAQGWLPHYPDILAMVPAGVDYLFHRSEVDRSRIGVTGFGLGGDLALRVAGTDERIAAVVAVRPFLDLGPHDLGLDLLRYGSLRQAVQWRQQLRAQSALVGELDVLAFLPRISPRPFLILHLSGSPLPVSLSGMEARSLPAAQADASLGGRTAQVIGQWCEEHL
jgi:hypothetical protein